MIEKYPICKNCDMAKTEIPACEEYFMCCYCDGKHTGQERRALEKNSPLHHLDVRRAFDKRGE